MLYENTSYKFKTHYPADLIRSVAWYARAFGHLPHNRDPKIERKIPWNMIGISDCFFKTPRKKKEEYKIINQKYLDKTMIQFDSLHWVMNRFTNLPYYHGPMDAQCMLQLHPDAFWIAFEMGNHAIPLKITNKMIAKYSCFETSYLDMMFYFAQPDGKYFRDEYYVYIHLRGLLISAVA
jgi:hypothetical protein